MMLCAQVHTYIKAHDNMKYYSNKYYRGIPDVQVEENMRVIKVVEATVHAVTIVLHVL